MVSVPEEHGVRSAEAHCVKHRLEPLRAVEHIAEHGDLGLPVQTLELRRSRTDVFVRADGPSGYGLDQLDHSRERLSGLRVVGGDVVVEGDAETIAFLRNHMSETDDGSVDSKGKEGGDEGLVRVQKGAVEITDRGAHLGHGGNLTADRPSCDPSALSRIPIMVDYEIKGHVAILTLNRPEARNAINGEVAQAMEAALDRMEADPDVWVGVLAANGPVFCAGADLKAINSGKAGELATAKGGFGGFTTYQRRKPVIAAIDGLATAGGCEIALACDMIVASTQAAFGLAEVKRNLVAAAGGLYRLPKVIGKNVALEVALTGEPLSAERALGLGLVNQVVEAGQALTAALELAEKIAANAPLAVWESRALVIAADWEDEATLQRITGEAFGRVLSSEDTSEGLNAFIEKRAPQWKGR